MMPLQFIKKHIITIIVLLIMLIAMLCYIPIPRKLDKTYTGISFNDTDDETEIVEISMEGKYINYILEYFKSDRFEGSIVISNNEVTNGILYPVKFGKVTDSVYGGGLIYFYEDGFAYGGGINFLDIGEEVLIRETRGKGFIAAPAKDRETAVKIANKMMER